MLYEYYQRFKTPFSEELKAFLRGNVICSQGNRKCVGFVPFGFQIAREQQVPELLVISNSLSLTAPPRRDKPCSSSLFPVSQDLS